MFNQPATIDPAALMAAVGAAEASQGQFPFIASGSHTLLLAAYQQKNTEKGPCVFGYFVYAESSNPEVPIGGVCTKMWKLYPGKFPDSIDKEIGDMKSFVIALGGSDDPAQVTASGTALLTDNAGRGMLVKCNGVTNAKGNYTATYFSHKEGQTAEGITACRARLEDLAPMSLFAARAAAPAAAAPAFAAQPAPAPQGVAPTAAVAPVTNFLGGAPAAAPAQPAAAPTAAPFSLGIPGL